MFLNKFFYFLKGYVIIRAEGKNTEQFINLCAKNGIRLGKPEKNSPDVLTASVSMRDFLRMSPILKKSGCRVMIKSKHSPIHFIRTHKSCFSYAAGAALFPVLLFITSQFIWSVEINGAQDTDINALYKLLAENNIRPGVLKSTMPDSTTCKSIILNNTKGLTWAWVYTEGTKIRVEIREGRPVPEIPDKSEPCDIVAARDGIVRRISAYSGIELAEPDNVVCEGDLLIAGTIDTSQFGMYTVHADGEVLADTVHREGGYYNLTKTSYKRTGETDIRYTLNLFSKKIPLYKTENSVFTHYECETEKWEAVIGQSFHLGFGLTRDTYYETEPQEEQLTRDYVIQAAREELEAKISAELKPGAELLNSDFIVTDTDENTIFAELTMEFCENIAEYIPIT